MGCFEVKVLDPTINTIEVETCINGQVASVDIIQYEIASLEVTNCVALLPSDYDTIVSGIVPVWNILGGNGINISSQSGVYTVNASGLQSIGNYSLVGHSHEINDISGLQVALNNKQPSGSYAPLVHSHSVSDIPEFASSLSGLLPVKNILSGSGIQVSELNGIFTVAVTGTFGLTSEEVDDRVSNLLTAGQNIVLNYDDSGNLLTISTSGLQPSGNYSLVGHNHNSSDIVDLITTVSGLLPNTYDAAVPWTPNHTLADGTRYLVNDLVYENGRLYKANYENESVPTNDTTYWTDVGPGYRLNIDGRDIPNIPYPVTSVNGYTNNVELSTSDLDDFASAVSGLIPPSTFSSLTGTSGVVVSASGTDYVIGLLNPSIELSYITDLSSEGRSFLLYPSSSNLQALLTDETGSGLLVFNNSPAFSGIPTAPTAASGTNNTQIANTAFVRTEISNLVNSAPSTLDTLNELASALGNDANFSTTIANSLGQKANVIHTHSSADITNFNTSVSGLLPVKNILGSGYVNVTSNSGTYTVSISGLQPSGNYSLVGHSHVINDITNLSTVSGVFYYENKPVAILPSGGLQNQLLQKVSDSSYDLQWIDNFATELHLYAKNITGSTLYKGQAVYINGAQGDHPTIALASSSVESTSSKTIGVLKQDLLQNEFGYVITEGILKGIDTSEASSAGDLIWLSSTPGGVVYGLANKPYAPNHMVFIGYVLRKQQNDGIIYIKIQNGFELEELHNVAISGATSGNFLQYNGELWVPSTSGNFTSLSLNGTGVSVNGHSHLSSDILDFNSNVSGLLPTISNSGDNRILTSTGSSVGINAEANLEFNGSNLINTNANGSACFASIIPANGLRNSPALNSNYWRLGFNSPLQFVNSSNAGGTGVDTEIAREGSGIIRQNSNGSLASMGGNLGQSYRLYNKYINTTNNFERLNIGWVNDIANINVEAGSSSGISRDLVISTSGTSMTLKSNGLLDVVGSGNFSQSLFVNHIPVSLSGHTHTAANITDFDISVSGLLPVKNVIGVGYVDITSSSGNYTVSITGVQPSGSYAAASHGHAIGDVTGLQTELDSKAATSHTHIASQISDFASAVAAAAPAEVLDFATTAQFPANGLASKIYIATDASRAYQWTGSQYAEIGPASQFIGTHTHAASDITSGVLATARLGSGTADATTYLRGDSTFATPTAAQVGAAATAAVYEFTRTSKPADATGATPGPYTWSLPSGAKVVEIVAIGGGGGGGSGRRGAAGTARFGGSGGGGGAAVVAVLPADKITTSLTITVGAGGAGGAARTTDDTDGASGSSGSASVVAFNGANAVTAALGAWGGGGGATAGSAGTASSVGTDTFRGTNGGVSSITATAGSSFRPVGLAATGGAAGGGISSGNVAYGGGTQFLGSAQQAITGQVLTSQTGGAASTAAAGGDGPSGPDYGYGGCGGGASANGFNSGAGGNGGNGYVRITVWF